MTDLLAISLSAAVPIWIHDLQQRADLPEYSQQRCPEISQIIAEKGDRLLYRKKGETAGVFNALAEGIALLAFAPGGVTIFGNHYEAPHPAITPDNEHVNALRQNVEGIEDR